MAQKNISETSNQRKNGSFKNTISKISPLSSHRQMSKLNAYSEALSQQVSTNKMQMLTDVKKGTLSDYKRKQLEQFPLFQKIYSADNNSFEEKPTTDQSILVTGFGMRNLKSLQDALRIKEQEELRLKELYKRLSEEETKEEEWSTPQESSKSSTKLHSVSTVSTETISQDSLDQKKCIKYLLSLEKLCGEAEHFPEESPMREQSTEFDEFTLSKSKLMREAQIYLLQHKILDFFQFIITHLLSASPENPIDFIMELLNKCLLYRSHLGPPIVLYEKKHLEQLFVLMDRMKMGAIEMHQYTKGITSLGICDYNESPATDADKLVSKDVFVEEAYKAQIKLFNELIKVRETKKQEKPTTASVLETTSSDSGGSYFMPSSLVKPLQNNSSASEMEN